MTQLDLTEESPYLNLLEESFPKIKANILRCEKLGFPWKSIPFIKEENGEIVSHVGVLEYPLQINGKQYKTAGLHAVQKVGKVAKRALKEAMSPLSSIHRQLDK